MPLGSNGLLVLKMKITESVKVKVGCDSCKLHLAESVKVGCNSCKLHLVESVKVKVGCNSCNLHLVESVKVGCNSCKLHLVESVKVKAGCNSCNLHLVESVKVSQSWLRQLQIALSRVRVKAESVKVGCNSCKLHLAESVKVKIGCNSCKLHLAESVRQSQSRLQQLQVALGRIRQKSAAAAGNIMVRIGVHSTLGTVPKAALGTILRAVVQRLFWAHRCCLELNWTRTRIRQSFSLAALCACVVTYTTSLQIYVFQAASNALVTSKAYNCHYFNIITKHVFWRSISNGLLASKAHNCNYALFVLLPTTYLLTYYTTDN